MPLGKLFCACVTSFCHEGGVDFSFLSFFIVSLELAVSVMAQGRHTPNTDRG